MGEAMDGVGPSSLPLSREGANEGSWDDKFPVDRGFVGAIDGAAVIIRFGAVDGNTVVIFVGFVEGMDDGDVEDTPDR